MSPTLSTTTVVIRSVGEQTENICKELLTDVFGRENIFVIKNIAPFSLAVKKTFELGIQQHKKYTLAVDADVLIFKNAMPGFIASVESALQVAPCIQAFCFEGLLFDKLLNTWREVGLHLYQTQFLPKALAFVEEGTLSLRPETYVKAKMAEAGHGYYISKHPLGLHDFFQYQQSIVKKAILHCKKHEKTEEFCQFWIKNSAADEDFYWAKKGAEIASSLSQKDIIVDYRTMDDILKKYNFQYPDTNIDFQQVDMVISEYNKNVSTNNYPFENVKLTESSSKKSNRKFFNYIFKKEKKGNKRIVTLFGIPFHYTKKAHSLFSNYKYISDDKVLKKILDDKLYARSGYHINFNDPKTFNEKLNWLKLYWQHPLITLHADKYKVRDIVKDVAGEKYLIPLLGAWDNPEEVDFTQLPDQFVLKVNWGCGQNIIVTDKALLDEAAIRSLLNEWLKPENNNYWRELEWGYKNIQPKIIAEQYIKKLDADLPCYKFMCFNGEPQIVQIVCGDKRLSATADYVDIQWNILPFAQNLPTASTPHTMPTSFEEMRKLAKSLAKPFPFVRVDLFNIDGTIYFSECTFYSNAGIAPFTPSEWDRKLGDLLCLPQKHTPELRRSTMEIHKQAYDREVGKTAVVNYPMRSITIGITNKCSNRCLFYSYHNEDAATVSNVYNIPFNCSMIEFRKIVDMAYNGYVPHVHICGTGEPFMHTDILSMIDYIISIYGKASFQTNFCKPIFEKYNYLEEILKRKDHISYITTDLLSGNPSLHNSIKKGSDYYDTMDMLAFISENSSIPIMIACILTKHNYLTLADLVRSLRQRQINATLNIINLFSHDFNEQSSSSAVYCSNDIHITQELKKVRALGKKLHIPVTIPVPGDDIQNHCTVFWDKIQTWPTNGNAPDRRQENIIPHACRAVVRGELASLGYIFDYDNIMDLWNNKSLVQIRNNLLQGFYPSMECQYCYLSGEHSIYYRKQLWITSAHKNMNIFKKSNMIKNLSANSLCIDCGANIGLITETMAQTGATIHSFEPHPTAFESLKTKFVNQKNIILHQQAVLDRNDSLRLFMYKCSDSDPLFWSQGASIHAEKDDIDANNYVNIEAIDLVEFIKNLNQNIDILKLDVEGAEYDILIKLINNNLHKKIKHILVETHDRHIPDIIPKGKTVRELIKNNNITNINLDWV